MEALLSWMHRSKTDTIDADTIRQWIAEMLVKGMKVSTCKRYYGKVHSIYNEWNGKETASPFDEARIEFGSLNETHPDETERNLGMVKRLMSKKETSEDWLYIGIFFYLLYTPSASLHDVINLKFDSVQSICQQTDDIINACDSSHGRQYVFPLKQGKSRPNEIAQTLTKQLQQLLSAAGMRFEYGFSRLSITSIWIAAALREKISLENIRACIGAIPREYQALSLVGRKEIDRMTEERIVRSVANSINSQTKQWFVMKLRKGVSVDDVKSAIVNQLPDISESMMLYYPTRTEVHKEGHKRITEEIPYLPDVLFFKIPHNKVRSLFAKIGDKAWCYKTSLSQDSDYFVISDRQMTVFQQCVGQFTPDIHMELVDMKRPLEKGRRVKVVGGMMAGYEGEILDVEDTPGKRVFFLAISGDTQARWTAYVDDLYIQPLE